MTLGWAAWDWPEPSHNNLTANNSICILVILTLMSNGSKVEPRRALPDIASAMNACLAVSLSEKLQDDRKTLIGKIDGVLYCHSCNLLKTEVAFEIWLSWILHMSLLSG
jgi:hypothetical protein